MKVQCLEVFVDDVRFNIAVGNLRHRVELTRAVIIHPEEYRDTSQWPALLMDRMDLGRIIFLLATTPSVEGLFDAVGQAADQLCHRRLNNLYLSNLGVRTLYYIHSRPVTLRRRHVTSGDDAPDDDLRYYYQTLLTLALAMVLWAIYGEQAEPSHFRRLQLPEGF